MKSMMRAGTLIFITGGVRSGKSAFAERMAIQCAEATSGSLHYIATGRATDQEMESRILRHQEERKNGPYPWKTWEQPMDIGQLAPFFQKHDVVLLDCLTTLLSNELFHEGNHLEDGTVPQKVKDHIMNGLIAVSQNCRVLIVVSNEVLFEPIHQKLVLLYARLLGELHVQIVKIAERAYQMEAGIPLLMKGEPL
ncbi:bifunctional adenosylcobinamide kinase/adenosylcobinamide-phosphate guanylyltransferase [Sporolactobacillus sp. THM19-2]|uniref:bifunctional adenosylcobinamide kinase/adenosylcobinamide-phosphate guanylyltransferase n=1 Tax=Sporolactobacillus sp. THM19-2 TaxID=2511171 RepID=UPI001F0EFFC5|nr:bifunctional adenosylcobinamide kinase/adenosylcobinamide-phosphate guanylyltransferase [Sporolactobacillus sp. THM19-2]